VSDCQKDEDRTDILSAVLSRLCNGHRCEDVVNALVNVLADVIRYSIKPQYHDETVNELAAHLKIRVAVLEAENTQLQ
jgi:hypothetical protein